MTGTHWTRRAQSDLDSIDDYLSKTNPEFADTLFQLAVEAAQFLEDWPRAGALVHGDTRKWRVENTPYILVYRVAGDVLQILRVRHSSENWRSPS